jgi:hypothetical protein
MKNLIAISICALLSLPAMADFKIGTYEGTDKSGGVCSLDFVAKTFVGNKKLPLTERVEVKHVASGKTFMTFHPIKGMDMKTKSIKVDHDLLVGANKSGAGLIINMGHSPMKKGPQSFSFYEFSIVTKKFDMVVCSNLKFI